MIRTTVKTLAVVIGFAALLAALLFGGILRGHDGPGDTGITLGAAALTTV